ncbi:hypothetical protein LEN26_000250 [Aphanomyces euteiches]|nr:hypothetical protein AeMF1_001396 [Aphanomyces euteiches]KAH9163958.1 hypothetical protein LEN26_000250 [Aphanomyces euteiches]KAH9195120.1 hypothetical protein AeNC1_002903 [Aphanomyces euteiches]
MWRVLGGERAATPFSEIAAAVQRLKDTSRKAEDTLRLLERLVQYSEITRKRDALLDAKAVAIVLPHLRSMDGSSSLLQQYSAAILVNLSQCDRGRLAMSSCDGHGCVSYRHACPLSSLLQIACNSSDRMIQRVCTAAVLNCSFHSTCMAKIEDVGGINLLLKLLKVNDEDVALYTAATCWNLSKSPAFLLKLETMYSIPADVFAKTLSQVLWTRCRAFGLAVHSVSAMDSEGVLESTGDNATLVFAAAVNSKLAIVLRMEQCNAIPAAKDNNQETKQQPKSVQKFDERGKLVAVTCAVCTKLVKDNGLACAAAGCHQMYHMRCSRWAKMDAAWIDVDKFYCDAHAPSMPLQYADFIAAEASSGRDLLTKPEFEMLDVVRIFPSTLCMLRSPTQTILAIGLTKYTCRAKDNTPIVKIQWVLRQATSMCYAQPSNVAGKLVMPFSFPFVQAKLSNKVIEAESLVLWPNTHAVAISETLYMTKPNLDQAFLYEFDGRNDERCFSVGASDGSEIWMALQTSHAKCMKLITEAKARPGKKKKAVKPRVERKFVK